MKKVRKTEILKIFDSKGKHIGESTRSEVHAEGLWHETFHCWFVSVEGGKCYLHFQLRSEDKQDYPDTLDISAAGHLTAEEDVSDGVREVHEELGVELSMEDLVPIGTIPDEIIQNDIIDREFTHVFLYRIPSGLNMEFNFHIEEVAGIFKVGLDAFEKLWLEEVPNIHVEGIVLNEQRKQISVDRTVYKDDFVPHDDNYIGEVIERIKEQQK